jgi:mannose-6-phosphate isomerase-like protein (cupin superfamily)
MVMKISNIYETKEWFEVLETTARSQTAVMILKPGQPSSNEANVHKKSDQAIFLLDGELHAEVDGKKRVMIKGDSCIIPAGTPHRFENLGADSAITFNVYSPPEYPPDEKG